MTGWTLLDTATSGTMQTDVYSKVAAAADAGRICSVLADSDAGMSAGAYGGLTATATASAASGPATMWTVLLRQAS